MNVPEMPQQRRHIEPGKFVHLHPCVYSQDPNAYERLLGPFRDRESTAHKRVGEVIGRPSGRLGVTDALPELLHVSARGEALVLFGDDVDLQQLYVLYCMSPALMQQHTIRIASPGGAAKDKALC
jgi:hypothetical protein